jgi:hypothetical protein
MVRMVLDAQPITLKVHGASLGLCAEIFRLVLDTLRGGGISSRWWYCFEVVVFRRGGGISSRWWYFVEVVVFRRGGVISSKWWYFQASDLILCENYHNNHAQLLGDYGQSEEGRRIELATLKHLWLLLCPFVSFFLLFLWLRVSSDRHFGDMSAGPASGPLSTGGRIAP